MTAAAQASTRPGRVAPSARPTLRARLLASLLPPLLVLFALSGAVSYFGALHFATSVFDGWLRDSAEALAQRVAVRQGRPTLDLPEAARQILEWDATDTTWFEIVGERRGHMAGQPGLPSRADAFDAPGQARVYDGAIGGVVVRVASVTLRPGGSDEAVQVIVAETLRKRDALAAEVLLSILLPELVLLAIAMAVVSWTLGRMLSPVQRVAEALETQTHSSLEPVDDRGLPGEVVPLTHAMNSLLERLQVALAAQQQFIADAAHQLRTPITALKLLTDEAVRETEPARLRPLLGELQQAASRTARLSNQLLALARAEPGAAFPSQRFDLGPVVVEAASRWLPVALARRIDLGFAVPEADPIEVEGQPDLLAEAIHNLLDNAIKYGRPQGQITVGVRADAAAASAEIEVLDDGPGIPAADRDRVVQRFQRLHRPATGAGDHGDGAAGDLPDDRTGAGLGLAIVAGIARNHRGRLLLDDPPDGGPGLCARIRLPLAGAPPRPAA